MMAIPEDLFSAVEDAEPVAAMWVGLRGHMTSQGMPADVADECIKATSRMAASNQEEKVETLRLLQLQVQATIMGVDLSNLNNKEN